MKRQSTKAAAQPSKVVQQMPKAEAQPPRKKTRAQNKPALKPAFDVRQITKLRLNFQPKVRPSRKPALEHECRVYHKLTFREVKQAVQLRELKWSYSKIANKMKRYPNAVHYALKQWDRRGGQYADGRRNNGQHVKCKVGDPQVQQYLLAQSTLQAWAGLGLQDRCYRLEQSHHVRITWQVLRRFYMKNGLHYLKSNYAYQQAQGQDPNLVLDFALELAALVEADKSVVYFDESTLNMWMRPSATWQAPH
jgi:inhibitor of KinA sporulation pathway (predicted exonuclease)